MLIYSLFSDGYSGNNDINIFCGKQSMQKIKITIIIIATGHSNNNTDGSNIILQQ